MLQRFGLVPKNQRNLAFISILSMGIIYQGATAQAYATSLRPISTNISQVHAADTNASDHASHSHSLLHALGSLLGRKSSSTDTTSSAISHISSSGKSSNIGQTATSATSNAKPYHRWLSLLGHLTREMFTPSPTSFSPSPQTLAHAAGKTPVILVHGTWANGNILQDMYKSLDKAGIPTYVSTFGTGGRSLLGLLPRMGEVAPAAQAEKELAAYIDKVQQETGASKVDLVGHSQGGLLVKDYLAHDTKDNVQAVVDLGATNHGTTLSGSSKLLNLFPTPIKNLLVKGIGLIAGPGATDQLPDSAYIQNLNKYPDTKAGVHYLVLSTKNDLISTPYQNTYLKPVPGADVTNQEIHTIPSVTGFVGHNMYPIFPGVINRVKQYIEEKGEPAGMTSFSAQSGAVSPVDKTTPVVSAVTPPTVSLLG